MHNLWLADQITCWLSVDETHMSMAYWKWIEGSFSGERAAMKPSEWTKHEGVFYEGGVRESGFPFKGLYCVLLPPAVVLGGVRESGFPFKGLYCVFFPPAVVLGCVVPKQAVCNISPELSDLVVYTRSVPFRGFSQAARKPAADMSSFSESEALRHVKETGRRRRQEINVVRYSHRLSFWPR